MLLAFGLITMSAGYAVVVWGQRVASRNPQSFAYLIGLSQDGTMDTTGSSSGPAPQGSPKGTPGTASSLLPLHPNPTLNAPSGALR